MIFPLGIAGSFQVMAILKYEGNDVMTTGPGAGEEENGKDSKKGLITLPMTYYLQLSVLSWEDCMVQYISQCSLQQL